MPEGLAKLLGAGPGPAAVAAPRDAATVILLRPEDGGGYTVFLVKRAQAIAFMGGAHVFPGGRVDPKTDPNVEAAAVREVEEECGVKLDVRGLHLWARWVTPEVEPKRFDARFFVAVVPRDQVAAADEAECTEGEWLRPAAAVEENGKRISLPPPTLWNLLDLAALKTVDDVLAEAATRQRQGIQVFMPRALASAEGRLALTLPGDPQYEDPAAPAPPEERKRRFELDEGRWVAYRGG